MGRSTSTLTRRFARPSPRGRGIDLKIAPLPLGEGGAKRRVRVERLLPRRNYYFPSPAGSRTLLLNSSSSSCEQYPSNGPENPFHPKNVTSLSAILLKFFLSEVHGSL